MVTSLVVLLPGKDVQLHLTGYLEVLEQHVQPTKLMLGKVAEAAMDRLKQLKSMCSPGLNMAGQGAPFPCPCCLELCQNWQPKVPLAAQAGSTQGSLRKIKALWSML